MTFDEINIIVKDHLALVAIKGDALAQAKTRAAKFLVAEAILADHLKELQQAKAQLQTISTATYAQVMKGLDSKKVTENKINAEADPSYSQNREALEMIDAEAGWIKTHMKIFENAHVMYRQYGNE